MHEEAGFLSVIRQTPADDTARLVYADWLDEQDDPACKLKADFVRLELHLANEPEDDSIPRSLQLQELAILLDPDWLVVVSSPKIEGCRMWLDNECPGVWSRLTSAHKPAVRTCEACQKSTYYAKTVSEAWLHVRRGDCTAVTLAALRKPNDLPGLHLYPGLVFQTLEELIERPRLPRTREERCPDRQPRTSPNTNDALAEEHVWGGTPQLPTQPPRRQNGRRRNRCIERENWKDETLE